MAKKVVLILIILLFSSFANAEYLTGYAKVIDGDTLVILKKKIRLFGIDAPEMKQKCNKGFSRGESYLCGVFSKKQLINKLNNKKINCKITTVDRYKRLIGICFLKNEDINEWMVTNGYAVAYRKFSKKYVLSEKKAKENLKGIWSGYFINPEKWRKLR
tara:strand:- start:65 stop:541 length:477 start_codon:yes stop_codon:yes gene_type:complete